MYLDPTARLLPGRHKLYYSKNFERFVLENVHSWRLIIQDWVVIGNVTVIHFEDVLSNKTREIEKVLEFLELNIDPSRLECVKYCRFDMFQRSHQRLEPSPYSENLRRIVTESIMAVDAILTQYGHAGIPFEKYSIP